MYSSRRSHHQQNATISMQPRCRILVHFNTHTRSHYQHYRQNSHPNTPPRKTRYNRPSHSYAKQHVLLLQWSSFPPKRRPTYGLQHLRHFGHPIHGQTRNHRLSSHLFISPYKRYVDDISLQTTGEEMADQFHYTMNNLHPKLKFEIEKPEITPNGFSLSLLLLRILQENSKETAIRSPPISDTGKVKDQLHSQ